MFCENCGEEMMGDGYKTPFHCIWAPFEDWSQEPPDCDPIYCTNADDWEHMSSDDGCWQDPDNVPTGVE